MPNDIILMSESAGHLRGWLHSSDSVFFATFFLAIALSDAGSKTVTVIVPPAATKDFFDRTKSLARKVLESVKKDPARLEAYSKAIKSFTLASRPLQMDEPARWVAYGFDATSPIPDWLKARLEA
jgi:hypothetical protein